jgi:predicted glycosyltransferase involved in capsule biosynthesis
LGTGIADLGNRLIDIYSILPILHITRLLYEAFVGGATIFTEEQFRRANGYSNDFWGWGGEDDDFYSRQNGKRKI